MQKNSIVLLTGLVSLDAGLWKEVVVEQGIMVRGSLFSLVSCKLSDRNIISEGVKCSGDVICLMQIMFD
jgi:hypothetical protein